jgi:hypothetical protein
MRPALAIVCFLALVVAAPVRAQEGRRLPADRLRFQIWRTREMVDFAGDRTASCRAERSSAALADALELQGRAESALRQGRPLAALQLTRAARERCLEALAACRLDEAVPDMTQRALERTDRVLARGGALPWGGSPMGRGRWRGGRGRSGPREGPPAVAAPDAENGAVRLQGDAWRELKVGRYEAALRLTLAARALVRSGGGR